MSSQAKKGDPFPSEEFGGLLVRLPRYARLAWALARDPRISRTRRAAVLAGVAYLVSPVDLVPGFIPVVGQMDDLFVALTAIRLALGGLPADVRAGSLAEAGLSQSDLDADLRTIGVTTAWIARNTVRVGVRVASAATRAGLRAGCRLLRFVSESRPTP